MVPESGTTHFLSQETVKDRCHTSSLAMPSRMVFEKVATPQHTLQFPGYLLAYLIAFLRLVTCKLTVLHLLSFNAHLV